MTNMTKTLDLDELLDKTKEELGLLDWGITIDCATECCWAGYIKLVRVSDGIARTSLKFETGGHSNPNDVYEALRHIYHARIQDKSWTELL